MENVRIQDRVLNWLVNMVMQQNVYLIKDVARSTGLSTYTIKYYLKLGLLKEAGRSPETNFRYFDDSTVERLSEIRRLRKQKISLRKIKEIIETGNVPQ